MGQSNVSKIIGEVVQQRNRDAAFRSIPGSPELDTTFERDGRVWRVTACTDTFIIGTCNSVPPGREPKRASDMIHVKRCELTENEKVKQS